MLPLHRSILLLVITMTIWGSTFVVTKELVTQLPPLALAFMRVLIGALVLVPFALRRRDRTQRPPWRVLVLLGVVGVAGYYILFNLALVYTSAVQGALVQSCIPAATAVLAMVWLREQATMRRWLGIVLSVAGVLIVFSGDSSEAAPVAVIGNVLMFATVLAWAWYTSLAKQVAQVDPVVVTASLMSAGALLLLPFAAVEIALKGVPRVDGASWLALLYLGAGASGIAYLMYNDALRHMDASQAGVYTNLIPIVGVITGVVVLGEPLSLRAVLGGAIVMAGVWITAAAAPVEEPSRGP
jgi:drug/metabolite transporter (DMT)-like permease